MISSYNLSERYNFQTILWDSCGLIVAGVRCLSAIVGRLATVLSHFLPLLLMALALTALLAAVVVAVAMVPLTFWAGLLVIGAFGWVTFPRAKAVK